MAAVSLVFVRTQEVPDRGFEYPLFWGIVVLSFVVRGGGPYSMDARLGREV